MNINDHKLSARHPVSHIPFLAVDSKLTFSFSGICVLLNLLRYSDLTVIKKNVKLLVANVSELM